MGCQGGFLVHSGSDLNHIHIDHSRDGDGHVSTTYLESPAVDSKVEENVRFPGPGKLE